jgi:predicted nucleotidyltransferase
MEAAKSSETFRNTIRGHNPDDHDSWSINSLQLAFVNFKVILMVPKRKENRIFYRLLYAYLLWMTSDQQQMEDISEMGLQIF